MKPREVDAYETYHLNSVVGRPRTWLVTRHFMALRRSQSHSHRQSPRLQGLDGLSNLRIALGYPYVRRPQIKPSQYPKRRALMYFADTHEAMDTYPLTS